MIVKTLDIKTSLNIQKPINEVFDAIVDHKKMSSYFISTSTGNMEEGKTLIWQFPEFDAKFPVRIEKIEKNKYISYYWEEVNGKATLVEITLTKKADNNTSVVVIEKSRDNDEAGLKWLKGNTEGWANFLACLKAYLEYGINLRKGSFDPAKLA
ncbi:ATPase [bacterium]|nr:MAG: ATPase [bacterium]